jgi:hypothetical protein
MEQSLLEVALREWSTHMNIAPSSEVLCTPNMLGVRVERTYKLPMKEGDLNFILSSDLITVPVFSDLSPESHLKDLEETLWQSGYGGSLTLEETHTWKDLMEVSVEDLMNIVLEQGFRGYLGIKVLERRLSVC